jgi:hypothetical protein
LAEGDAPPAEVLPPPSPRKYWTRRGIAEWLVERLAEDKPSLVGIDHGFSFPLRYFEVHGLKPEWPAFLDDFQRHWPTDEDIYVDSVRDGAVGNGAARMGNARWRRLTEERAGGAKSVFHFDVQGSVAKSTHAGIPWLRFIRQRLGGRVHFWPFHGSANVRLGAARFGRRKPGPHRAAAPSSCGQHHAEVRRCPSRVLMLPHRREQMRRPNMPARQMLRIRREMELRHLPLPTSRGQIYRLNFKSSSKHKPALSRLSIPLNN